MESYFSVQPGHQFIKLYLLYYKVHQIIKLYYKVDKYYGYLVNSSLLSSACKHNIHDIKTKLK